MTIWGKDKHEAPSKGSEIRKMGGFDGRIETAAESAPASTAAGSSDEINIVRKTTSRKGRPSTVPQGPTPQEIEAAQQLKARQEAMQKIAQEMAKDVAAVPYEVWAFVAQDEELRLATEEEVELAEAYALVAQSLPLGNMNPLITCGLFLISRNAKIVKKKLMEHKKRLEMDGITEVENAKAPQR